MKRQPNKKQNIADLSKNTRVKVLANLKTQLGNLVGTLDSAIARLNDEGSRPIVRANDIAQDSIGHDYLSAPENVDSEHAFALMLGHLLEDTHRLERRVLRAENMIKG